MFSFTTLTIVFCIKRIKFNVILMYHFAGCAIDWSGERWNLSNMADYTQLGSPDRLEAKQAIVQAMSTTVRRLE